MIDLFADILATPWLLAQAETTAQATEAAAQAASADGATGAPTSSLFTQILGNPFNLIMISGILFILLVLRPQQRQMKEHQKALTELKKNDRVVTNSGIHGTVVQASSDDPVVVLRIDENTGTRVTVNRDAISKIITETKD